MGNSVLEKPFRQRCPGYCDFKTRSVDFPVKSLDHIQEILPLNLRDWFPVPAYHAGCDSMKSDDLPAEPP